MSHSSLCFSFFALLWNKHISLIASLLMQYFFFQQLSLQQNSLHRPTRMPLNRFRQTKSFFLKHFKMLLIFTSPWANAAQMFYQHYNFSYQYRSSIKRPWNFNRTDSLLFRSTLSVESFFLLFFTPVIISSQPPLYSDYSSLETF